MCYANCNFFRSLNTQYVNRVQSVGNLFFIVSVETSYDGNLRRGTPVA